MHRSSHPWRVGANTLKLRVLGRGYRESIATPHETYHDAVFAGATQARRCSDLQHSRASSVTAPTMQAPNAIRTFVTHATAATTIRHPLRCSSGLDPTARTKGTTTLQGPLRRPIALRQPETDSNPHVKLPRVGHAAPQRAGACGDMLTGRLAPKRPGRGPHPACTVKTPAQFASRHLSRVPARLTRRLARYHPAPRTWSRLQASCSCHDG